MKQKTSKNNIKIILPESSKNVSESVVPLFQQQPNAKYTCLTQEAA